jgi:hypothetical protein
MNNEPSLSASSVMRVFIGRNAIKEKTKVEKIKSHHLIRDSCGVTAVKAFKFYLMEL